MEHERRRRGVLVRQDRAGLCCIPAGKVGRRDGRRAHLRVRGCAARRADFRFHDRRLGAVAARIACARIQPDHQRGARHQPRSLRHLLQAACHDRVGVVTLGFSVDFIDFFENKRKGYRYINSDIQSIFFTKYQANSLTTFKSSKNFSEEIMKFIDSSSPLYTHQIIIPNEEIFRLQDLFDKVNYNLSDISQFIVISKKHPIIGKSRVSNLLYNKILDNEEIRTIIAALGAGFGEDFDAEKSRYGKIILMADADVDGSHIRTLLLTFFFLNMRELINSGRLYIAQPPLYKVKKGKQEYYAYNDQERDEVIKRIRKDKGIIDEVAVETTEHISVDGITIQRFKGLGEMNPIQLWSTTMNPETRTLLQVSIANAAEASMVFDTLMGDKVEPRREFIEKNAQYVKNLDV